MPKPTLKLQGSFEAACDAPEQADISAVSYGTAGGGVLHGKYARGTEAAPLPIKAGDIFAGVGGRAFYNDAGTYKWQLSSPTSLHWVASEDHTNLGFGSYFRILTTPKGSTYRQERVIVADNGTLWVHDENLEYDAATDAHTKPVVSLRMNISAASVGAAYGATVYGSGDPGFRGLAAGGTPANPQAAGTGRWLAFLGGHGHTGIGWSGGTNGLIGIKTKSMFSPTSNATEACIETTAQGSTQRRPRVTVDENGIYWHKPDGQVVNIIDVLQVLYPGF